MKPLSIEIGRSITGTPVHLTDKELGSHIEVEGLSGSGKSFFLEWLSRCFIKQRIVFFTITPHQKYYDNMLNWLVVKDYKRKVNIFDPSYPHKVVGLDFFWSDYAQNIQDEIDRTTEAQLKSQAEDL